jgi:hypothetical protein
MRERAEVVRSGPARRAALFAAVGGGLLALAATGCSVKAQPVRAVGLNRSTPRATYEYLLATVRALQVEAEWAAFSPGFKRRLSESAGRNVDFGDYSHARATIAGNDRREIRAFLESEYAGETFVSDKEVVVTLRAGGQELRPRLVKLSTWELVLSGEDQPVSGFVPRTADVVRISDGTVQVRVTPEENTQSFLREIPADRIESMTVKSEWFVDDFGGVEAALRSGVRRGEETVERVPLVGPRAGDPTSHPSPGVSPPFYDPPPPDPGSPDAGAPAPSPGGDFVPPPSPYPMPLPPPTPETGPGSPDG